MTEAKQPDGRVAYADLLRVAATVAVLVIHITSVSLYNTAVSSVNWNVLNVFNSLSRWCVPIFFMLSGMFLLSPEKSLTIRALMGRQFARVAAALLFWGTFYALAHGLLQGGTLSLAALLSAVRTMLWTQTYFHLWFLYVIMGLYLLTPILRAFVKGASRGDFHWVFLLVFLLGSLLPTVLYFRPSQSVSAWMNNLFLTPPVQTAICYIGCYLAGYYLKTFPLSRRAEHVIYTLGALGVAVTLGGTALLSHRAGAPDFFFYSYATPNVLCTAAAVFLLFRRMARGPGAGRVGKLTATASALSFGVYLTHEFLIMLLTQFGVTPVSFPSILAVPLFTAGIFLVSLAIAWAIRKLPVIGRYIT